MPDVRSPTLDLYQEFQEYERALDAWREITAGHLDFYLGKQFTSAQLAWFTKKGLPPLAMNKVRPIIDHQAAILTENAPQFRVKPVSIGDADMASILDDLLIWLWEENDGNALHYEILRNMLIFGVGWWKVYIDRQGNFGKPIPRIDVAHPHDVFPDPQSRRSDIRDARKVFYRTQLSAQQVKDTWPDAELEAMRVTDVEGAVSSGYSNVDGAYRRGDLDDILGRNKREYEIHEVYERVMRPMVTLWNGEGMIVALLTAKDFVGHEQEVKETGHFGVKFQMPHVHMTVFSGSEILEEGDLPIADYPLLPIFNSYNGIVTGTSEVLFLKAPQQAKNSVTNSIVQYLAHTANAPWQAEDGAIVDEKDFTDRAAVQGALLKHRRGYAQPQRSAPPPMPQGLALFGAELDRHMEYVASAPGVSQGQPEDAPGTFRGLVQLEQYGARKVGMKMKPVNSTLKRLGNIIIPLVQNVMTAPEILRIVGADGLDREVRINQLTMEGSIVNDITAGVYDVQVVPGSTVATSVMSDERQAAEYFQAGLIDREEWIQRSSVKNKEQLLKRMSEVEQARGTIASLQQEIKKLQIQMAGMEGEVRRARRYAELKEYEAELDKLLDKQRLRGEVKEAELVRAVSEARSVAPANGNQGQRAIAREK